MAWHEHLLTGRIDTRGTPNVLRSCFAAYVELRQSMIAQGIPLTVGLGLGRRVYAPPDEATPPPMMIGED